MKEIQYINVIFYISELPSLRYYCIYSYRYEKNEDKYFLHEKYPYGCKETTLDNRFPSIDSILTWLNRINFLGKVYRSVKFSEMLSLKDLLILRDNGKNLNNYKFILWYIKSKSVYKIIMYKPYIYEPYQILKQSDIEYTPSYNPLINKNIKSKAEAILICDIIGIKLFEFDSSVKITSSTVFKKSDIDMAVQLN